jgi:hypothetical protein
MVVCGRRWTGRLEEVLEAEDGTAYAVVDLAVKNTTENRFFALHRLLIDSAERQRAYAAPTVRTVHLIETVQPSH